MDKTIALDLIHKEVCLQTGNKHGLPGRSYYASKQLLPLAKSILEDVLRDPVALRLDLTELSERYVKPRV